METSIIEKNSILNLNDNPQDLNGYIQAKQDNYIFESDNIIDNEVLSKIANNVNNIAIISKNLNVLLNAKNNIKNATFYLKSDEFDISLIPTLCTYNLNLCINFRKLTKERIDCLHNIGIKINAYIVNRKDELELLKFWQVDYVVIDNLK